MKTKDRKLTLVISSLGAGGAERVLSVLSDYWIRDGYEISLLLLSGNIDTAYQLNPRIVVYPLALLGKSRRWTDAVIENWRRLQVLRREITQTGPDMVLSFMTETSVLCILALVGKSIPVIACEHSDPFCDPPGRFWRYLRYWVFRWADRVVVLNSYAVSYFSAAVQRKICVIPNAVKKNKLEPDPGKRIIAIGRLEKVKRFDRLIRAFASLHPSYPDWELVILGDGSELTQLQQLVHSLQLDAFIQLPGRVDHPDHYLCHSGIFVLCSEYEGFPMALCEAMAAAVASIAVYYHPGVEDIIRDGENGLIVYGKDEKSLARTMTELLENPQRRMQLAEQGRCSMSKFDWQCVGKQWQAVFDRYA